MEISEYERRRLKNIDRNNEYLTNIGIEVPIKKPAISKRKHLTKPVVVEVPTRRSSRLESIEFDFKEPSVSLPRKRGKVNEDAAVAAPVITSIKGEFIAPDHKVPQASATTSAISSSSSQLSANVDAFLSDYLCRCVDNYGKAAVMTLANYNTLPRFSKYSGVVEWKNAVFLWVNIGGQTGYHNAFTQKGRNMMWYGGSRMHADSPITSRMLRAGEMTGKSTKSDVILLFVRMEGENYCCLGRVGIVGYNLSVHPIQIQLELLNYDSICHLDQFKLIQKAAV